MSDKTMDTYKRTALVLVRGSGCVLEDEAGRKYLDFASGIGVNSLGHGHPALVKAISDQAARLIHVSNYYQTRKAAALSEELCAVSGMDAVFLCNSGAEANECAIKIARKWGEGRRSGGGPGGSNRTAIVTLRGSFHGRTVTTLAATGQDKFHEHFAPLTPGFSHVPANDAEALKAALSDNVCALIIEPIQGEGGVVPLSDDYLRLASRLCAERGILLVADEIQCGVGRTGTFLALDRLGLKPDVATVAKGLAGGVPIGAALARGEAARALGKGDHGSTFGGGPLAAAAARVVIKEISSPSFMEAVARKGARMLAAIGSWNHPLVKDARGRGLMLGAVVSVPPDRVKALCLERGLLVLTAGEDVVRLLPPLVISEDEIDRGLGILRDALDAASD
jgi:acetylornithine/N-succinyldiaminopimelate aminotransferase